MGKNNTNNILECWGRPHKGIKIKSNDKACSCIKYILFAKVGAQPKAN